MPALKQAKHLRRCSIVVLLFLVAWSLAAWVAARGLIVHAELERADALVVLSGSAAYIERTRRAARLYSEGRAPKIILTNDNQPGGWSNAQQRNPLFVERATEELVQAGVPPEKIEVISQPVTNTYEETLLLHKYATAHGLHSLLFVTSAYHSRRALFVLRSIFRSGDIQVGLDAVPTGQQMPQPAVWWLYARGWKSVAGEYVKLLYYRLRYH